MKVSGSAVPTAASRLPTAASAMPSLCPAHSMALVNISEPARITRKLPSRIKTCGIKTSARETTLAGFLGPWDSAKRGLRAESRAKEKFSSAPREARHHFVCIIGIEGGTEGGVAGEAWAAENYTFWREAERGKVCLPNQI